MRRIIILFVLVAGMLSSCEHSYDYSYTVTNSADTTVSIHLKTFKTDTVFQLGQSERKTIYATDHGVEGGRGPYFQDVSEDLDVFTVTKGALNSNRDYRVNGNWDFEEGDYATVIGNSEF